MPWSDQIRFRFLKTRVEQFPARLISTPCAPPLVRSPLPPKLFRFIVPIPVQCFHPKPLPGREQGWASDPTHKGTYIEGRTGQTDWSVVFTPSFALYVDEFRMGGKRRGFAIQVSIEKPYRAGVDFPSVLEAAHQTARFVTVHVARIEPRKTRNTRTRRCSGNAPFHVFACLRLTLLNSSPI